MKLDERSFGKRCFTWSLNRYQSQLSKTNSVVSEHNTRVMPSLLDQLQAGARWVEHSLRLVLPTTTTSTMAGFSERGCLCCAKGWPATWGRSRRCSSSLASARRRSLGGCVQGELQTNPTTQGWLGTWSDEPLKERESDNTSSCDR